MTESLEDLKTELKVAQKNYHRASTPQAMQEFLDEQKNVELEIARRFLNEAANSVFWDCEIRLTLEKEEVILVSMSKIVDFNELFFRSAVEVDGVMVRLFNGSASLRIPLILVSETVNKYRLTITNPDHITSTLEKLRQICNNLMPLLGKTASEIEMEELCNSH